MTTIIASMLSGKRFPPVPGAEGASSRTPSPAVAVIATLPFRPGLGPAHAGFEARFGAPGRGGAVAALLGRVSPAPLPPRLARMVAGPAPARAARPAPAETSARVEALLRSGGLWRDADLAAGSGSGADAVRVALRGLQDAGQAVHVGLHHWRSRFRGTDLREQGRTVAARLLGLLLCGLAVPVGEMCEHLGIDEREAAEEAESLRRQGHLARSGPGLYHCPVEVRERVVAAQGPAPLSDLGARIVDALAPGAPMRKTDLAETVGIGRGSANRMVDRLLDEGWLRETATGRYALA